MFSTHYSFCKSVIQPKILTSLNKRRKPNFFWNFKTGAVNKRLHGIPRFRDKYYPS